MITPKLTSNALTGKPRCAAWNATLPTTVRPPNARRVNGNAVGANKKENTMPRIDETAYRQLKATPTDRELRELYTPTLDERLLAQRHTTGKSALATFLMLLKTFQHLGYAVALSSVPMPIVSYIANQMECSI